MKIGIVGGEITGLFSAYYLLKEGLDDITIYEKNFLGAGSIHAAGLIEPYRFDRINTTSMIIKMINYKIYKSTEIKEVNKSWLVELLRNLNKSPPDYVWSEIKKMADFSLKEYKRLAEEKNDFDYHDDGLLEVYKNQKELEKGIEDEKRSPFKPKFEVAEVEGFVGGIFFPELSRISTEKFIERMRRELKEIRVINKEVKKVTRNGYIDDEKYDIVVVSAGIWTKNLNLPVTAFKGYGYRIKGVAKISKAFVLAEEGVAVSPLSDHIKITGGFDADFSYNSDRAELFLKRVKNLIDISSVMDLKMGFRPCSPDGFPILGKEGNLIIATGGCRLGWSYGPAMGRYVTDLALNKISNIDYFSRYIVNISQLSL
ncbi:FAD-dependent oxidoreductase [Sulfolobus sp. D5]|nr:FAD-dependent oxidoreductase [Sulfolobus sp. D5]